MKIFYKTQEKIRGKMAHDKIQKLNSEVIHMKKEIRIVVYDDELRMEAYRFEGIVQPFQAISVSIMSLVSWRMGSVCYPAVTGNMP